MPGIEILDYELPANRIAQSATAEREAARMLVIPRNGDFGDRTVRDLPELLNPNDLLIVNDTRVLPARLHVTRATGGRVELLLTQFGTDDAGKAALVAVARPMRRLRAGEILQAEGGITFEIGERAGEQIRLRADRPWVALRSALETIGETPLPPYIKARHGDDRERYQTVFAARDGAIAAPTAGLHLSPALLDRLQQRGVSLATVTLHVGLGTFSPLHVEAGQPLESARLHAERFEIPRETVDAIAACRARGGQVVAVGTTVVRTLESNASFILPSPHGDRAPIVESRSGETDLCITPGFRFQVVDRLLTNFHVPRSSLLMLVMAFAGIDRVRAAYAHAIATQYRFYSFGDACLFERAQ